MAPVERPLKPGAADGLLGAGSAGHNNGAERGRSILAVAVAVPTLSLSQVAAHFGRRASERELRAKCGPSSCGKMEPGNEDKRRL